MDDRNATGEPAPVPNQTRLDILRAAIGKGLLDLRTGDLSTRSAAEIAMDVLARKTEVRVTDNG